MYVNALGVEYEIVKQYFSELHKCNGCAFYKSECVAPLDVPNCSSFDREDGLDIIFVEVLSDA